MKTKMFAIWEKAKPDTQNIRGLNFAGVKPMATQVTKLIFLCMLSNIWHDLLYNTWIDRGTVYRVFQEE
jgi:hypothetical protein